MVLKLLVRNWSQTDKPCRIHAKQTSSHHQCKLIPNQILWNICDGDDMWILDVMQVHEYFLSRWRSHFYLLTINLIPWPERTFYLSTPSINICSVGCTHDQLCTRKLRVKVQQWSWQMVVTGNLVPFHLMHRRLLFTIFEITFRSIKNTDCDCTFSCQ